MTTITKTFVSLDSPTGARNGAGFYPCQGLYTAPAGKVPKVAMIATHYNVDFSEHYLAEYMASRGVGFWVGILATEAWSTSSCSSTH